MLPTAVVMNMFYTGLGIARSLGEQGIPVIGLSSHRGVYGEFTRYAKTVACPDSRNEPEALLPFLQRMGVSLGRRMIVFPTRDDDVLFLDRNREALSPYFELVVPERSVLQASLNKWETYLWAQRAGVATPRAWLIQGEEDLRRAIPEATYPCILKPVASYHWRKGGNWEKVGGRKALAVFSPEELLVEYAAIARADRRALLQEMVSGDDDCLVSAACYLDRESNLVAAFTTQKLAQAPEGLGTGFIVQAVERREILDPTMRLLREMRFTGIAEVEYKWDSAKSQYQLIEINPRPWDQHRLGIGCGVNLMHIAYCEHAGLAMPAVSERVSAQKWIAEDTFCMTALGLLWEGDRTKIQSLFRLARGERSYAVWSAKDPFPFFGYLISRFIPGLMQAGARAIWLRFKRTIFRKALPQKEGRGVWKSFGKEKNHG